MVSMGPIQRISDCAQTSETNHRASLTAARAGSRPSRRGRVAESRVCYFCLYAVEVIDDCKNAGS